MDDSVEALERAWARSDQLFELVKPELLFERGIPLRHPFIFYVGHLPAFAWNHIAVGVLGRPPLDERLDVLFARGIDPDDADGADEAQPERWPALETVLAYRDAVRAALRGVWADLVAARDEDELASWVLPLVIEHELMHHETLLYIIRQLDPSQLVRWEEWRPAVPGLAPEVDRVVIEAGPVRLGADHSELAFGWDNEFPSEVVEVPAFELDRVPVTVGRWLEFVEAGGYAVPELWDAEDWAWRSEQRTEHPLGWRRTDTGFEVRSMFRWHPLSVVEGWPVYVSYAEAVAFCRWTGTRLPTEAELHRAAFTSPDGEQRAFPWGDDAPGPDHGALDFRVHGRTRVGLYPAARSAWGVDELVGNGWEWSSTPFAPRAGFRAHLRTYPGYSTDFFDGRHFVVFGASWATDAQLIRSSFRNWYQRQYPYVFCTFRTAD